MVSHFFIKVNGANYAWLTSQTTSLYSERFLSRHPGESLKSSMKVYFRLMMRGEGAKRYGVKNPVANKACPPSMLSLPCSNTSIILTLL